jgi:hypothetical protein
VVIVIYKNRVKTIINKIFQTRFLPVLVSFTGAIFVTYYLFDFPFSLNTSFIWETDGLLSQAQIQSIIDSGIFGSTNHLGYPYGFTQWNNPEISYAHALIIWSLAKFFSITSYGFITLIAFTSVFLNSLFMYILASRVLKNRNFNYLFLLFGLLIPYSLYSLDHPHVITIYMYIALIILLIKIDSVSRKSIALFLIVLLSTNMFQLITITFIASILIIVYLINFLIFRENLNLLKSLLKIYFSILSIFLLNLFNFVYHSSINGQNGRTAYQSDIFAGKLTDLILSSPFLNKFIPNLVDLQNGVSGEIRQVGLPLVISIFFGLFFILVYPSFQIKDNGIKVLTSLFIITTLTFITGGFGNLQASLFVILGEISPMRSWSRLSILLGLISLVLLVIFLSERFGSKVTNFFASFIFLLAILDFSQVPRDSKFETNFNNIEESGFIRFIDSNIAPCPVLQLPVDTYLLPQSSLDKGWRYYWNGMIPYVVLPEFSWTAAIYVDSPGWDSLANFPTEIDQKTINILKLEYCAIVFDKNFSQYQIDRKAGLNSTQGLWPGLKISNSVISNFEDTRYSVYLIND